MFITKAVELLLISIMGISCAVPLDNRRSGYRNLAASETSYDQKPVIRTYLFVEDQKALLQMHDINYESLFPALLDFNQEYMGPQDDMGSLPASYENLVHKLFNYLISPKDKYIKVLSRTIFTFERTRDYDEPDEVYMFWKDTSVEDVLKKPYMRRHLVFLMIVAALNRFAESCDELEKTIDPFIINDESMSLGTVSRLNTEKRQLDLEIILLKVTSMKLALQELQNRVTFYRKKVLFTTHFPKKIGGLSLQGLLRYTVNAMISIRGFWIDWKIMSNFSNLADS